jgi:hypothetical protein
VQERFNKALDSLRRIGNLPLNFKQKTLMAVAQPCAAVLYGAEVTVWTPSQIHCWEGALISTLWGDTRRNRCREVFMSVLLPGHRADPVQALPFARLCALARMAQRHPFLQETMQHSLLLLRGGGGCQPPAGRGPISLALNALDYLGWSWSPPWTIATSNANIDMLSVELPLWAHLVRDALRCRHLQPAALRRADMQGCDSSLDLDATNHAWMTTYGGPLLSGTIRSVITGSVWTEDRRSRAQMEGASESGCCKHCPEAPLDTPDHLFWECPAWTSTRARFPELNTAIARTWPPCLRLCGIVPMTILPTPEERRALATNLQAMLAEILLVRQHREGHHPTRSRPDGGPSALIPRPPGPLALDSLGSYSHIRSFPPPSSERGVMEAPTRPLLRCPQLSRAPSLACLHPGPPAPPHHVCGAGAGLRVHNGCPPASAPRPTHDGHPGLPASAAACLPLPPLFNLRGHVAKSRAHYRRSLPSMAPC